jgi:hypothetical protein
VDYEGFKEKVSKKLLSVCKEVDELGEMFIEFEEAQKMKTKSASVYSDRKLLFDKLLKFDSGTIIQTI